VKDRGLPQPLPRQILTDSVYEAVKELVMDQHIEPGARVNIDQLARTLKVSQTPVREALARLEMDGLVIKEPLRGYSIAPILDAAAFVQLYEVRMLLEPFAARRATEQQSQELIKTLQRENDAMRKTLDSRGPTLMLGYREYREFAWQDARFHEAIVTASGNELLRETVTRLRSHLHLYRLYYTTGIGAETLAEHEKIAAAIAGGRPGDAAAAMEEHIRRSQERLAAGAREVRGAGNRR
jgi:DNA-binding GntR family transcriptional regulator